MKIRLQHVANSSSSSFILVGYSVPRWQGELLKEHRRDINVAFADGYYNEAWVGRFLTDIGQDFSLSHAEVEATKRTVKELLGRTDEPKIYMGVREQ